MALNPAWISALFNWLSGGFALHRLNRVTTTGEGQTRAASLRNKLRQSS